jgi:hypothetical protein
MVYREIWTTLLLLLSFQVRVLSTAVQGEAQWLQDEKAHGQSVTAEEGRTRSRVSYKNSN